MDASDNMDSQLADSSGKSSNRWIIKSSEWKATHQGQKKKAEKRPRRNSIGRRIMGGFQEEAREAHQRKEDAIRPVHGQVSTGPRFRLHQQNDTV